MCAIYKKLAPAVVLILLLCATANGYQLEVQFLSDNPMIFPVGRLVPGDFSDASDIRFQEVMPFFEMSITAEPDDAALGELTLMVRLSAAGEDIFTVSSIPYEFNRISGRAFNNQDLSNISGIHLGEGDEISGERLLPYIDGGNLRQGYYVLTLLISEYGDPAQWDMAVDNNHGIVSEGIQVYNPSQVDLIDPIDLAELTDYPILLWSFPRREGVIFRLQVVSGPADSDPYEVLESFNLTNVYTDVSFEIQPWQAGGDLTSYIYTGIGEERPLDPDSTYFWKVTAQAPSMFPGEVVPIESPIYRFQYSQPSGDAAFGMGGGQPGESGEESPPPGEEDPVFTLLRSYLSPDLYAQLIELLGGFEGWSINSDRAGKIEGMEMNMAQLAQFFQTHNIQVVFIAIAQ